MEKIWLEHYPSKVPAEINPDRFGNLNEVFEEAFKKYAHLPCFSNMGRTLSFSEIQKHSQDFASFLQNELKLQKGDRLAIQMPNLLQYPIAVFGALQAGLIVVNTNPLYTTKEMQYQFKDSGAKAILILANYAHLLEQVIKNTEIESVIVTEVGDMLKFPKKNLVNFVVKSIKKMVPPFNLPQAYRFGEALELGRIQAPKPVDVEREDIAFLQYTGGTTGISKGAMLTHRNLSANMMQVTQWLSVAMEEGQEIAIAPLPVYHIFSLTACLGFMTFGTHSVLITNPRDFKSFISDMKKYPFTVMTGVNTLFNALLNQPELSSVDFSRVKVSLAGGMALQRAVHQRWTETTKSLIIEGFGLTETSPLACANPVSQESKVGTIGLPVSSTDVKLIDENGQEVGVGGIGEICIKGPQVMKGYWKHPEETKKVLTDGWLATGDIGSIDEEGFVKIVDRKKDMILVSGFNVYPNEIEDVLAAHPGIMEVAAIGVPDVHSGEVVKVVVVRKDPELTSEQVIAFAKKSLTNYKVPKQVEFRSELPKTNVGKILRRALREARP